MKKVLHVITKSNFGGAQRYVYEIATGLPKDQFESHVALGGSGVLKTMLDTAGIPTHSIVSAGRDIKLWDEMLTFFRLIRIIRKVRPAILHLNSPKMGGLGGLAGRLCRVPKIIYTNHGWPFNESRPEWQIILIKTLSFVTLLLSHNIITLSSYESNLISSWWGAKKKTVIIPNSIVPFKTLSREDALTHLFGTSKAELIKQNNLHIVGMIGELTKNKGYEYAIEAFAAYKNETSILAIIGEGEDRNKIEKQIADNNLEGRVFLLGQRDEARQYLKAFDCLVLSSIKEGLPYVLLEAGFVGVPVISTNVGGIPELIENLKGGYVITPRRPKEIINALMYILENKENGSELSIHFKQKISESYDFDKNLNKIITLYNK